MSVGTVRLTRTPTGDGDTVARLTLDRPERCNSLTAEMMEDMRAQLEALRTDPPRAVIVAGAGAHFSTGGDLERFAREIDAGDGRAYARRVVGALHDVIKGLVDLPCPVIAEVQGALTGGALGLVLAAELVAMRRDAFIQPWYAAVGFGPDGGWTALLPERVGTAAALEIQTLNRRIDAQAALRLGLATELAAPDAPLSDVTDRWVARIGAHKRGTLTATRALIWDATRRDALARRLDAERDRFLELVESGETRAGLETYLSASKGER